MERGEQTFAPYTLHTIVVRLMFPSQSLLETYQVPMISWGTYQLNKFVGVCGYMSICNHVRRRILGWEWYVPYETNAMKLFNRSLQT